MGAKPTTLCDKGIRLNYLFQWVGWNKQVKRAAIVENRSLSQGSNDLLENPLHLTVWPPKFSPDIDDFIDDDFTNHDGFDVPPVRRLAETSRHFSNTLNDPVERLPIELRDLMKGCDDFEKVTTSECFEKLVRIRNDVLLLPIYTDFRSPITSICERMRLSLPTPHYSVLRCTGRMVESVRTSLTIRHREFRRSPRRILG